MTDYSSPPINSVPLGVLKAKTVKFAPPLPRWKRSAIERLGFGPIEKVALPLERLRNLVN